MADERRLGAHHPTSGSLSRTTQAGSPGSRRGKWGNARISGAADRHPHLESGLFVLAGRRFGLPTMPDGYVVETSAGPKTTAPASGQLGQWNARDAAGLGRSSAPTRAITDCSRFVKASQFGQTKTVADLTDPECLAPTPSETISW